MRELAVSVLFVILASFSAFAQMEYTTPISLHLATSRKIAEPGMTRDVYVQVESQGNENAFTFTFEWDTTRFANPRANLASGLSPDYVLTVNPYFTHTGRLGILVDGWNPLPVGRVNLVRITLDVFPNEGPARFKFSTNLLPCSTSDAEGIWLRLSITTSGPMSALSANYREAVGRWKFPCSQRVVDIEYCSLQISRFSSHNYRHRFSFVIPNRDPPYLTTGRAISLSHHWNGSRAKPEASPFFCDVMGTSRPK